MGLMQTEGLWVLLSSTSHLGREDSWDPSLRLHQRLEEKPVLRTIVCGLTHVSSLFFWKLTRLLIHWVPKLTINKSECAPKLVWK